VSVIIKVVTRQS